MSPVLWNLRAATQALSCLPAGTYVSKGKQNTSCLSYCYFGSVFPQSSITLGALMIPSDLIEIPNMYFYDMFPATWVNVAGGNCVSILTVLRNSSCQHEQGSLSPTFLCKLRAMVLFAMTALLSRRTSCSVRAKTTSRRMSKPSSAAIWSKFIFSES